VQIHRRQRRDARHNWHVSIIVAGKALCYGLDRRDPNRLVS
jgi:hypothetical protein